MNCEEIDRLLDAYFDGELELTRRLDLEAHLAVCFVCKKTAEEAINFRNSVRMNMPVYRAPPKLEARIRTALREESGSKIKWMFGFWRSLGLATAILVLSLLLAWAWMAASRDQYRELIVQAISDHSRSLLVDHLLDVTSSDQRIVKPWFTGKLDYSPPIVDLMEAGYKLVGARLDILENRRVAAIVYQHQDRSVNVFVWPAAKHTIDFDSRFLQGYNLCGWNQSGLNYLIVSELSEAEMEKLEDLLRDRIK